MRTLKKNKQKLYYSLYLGNVKEVDENGDYTGGSVISYDTPVEFSANIMPKSTDTSIDDFGKEVDYNYLLVTDLEKLPLTTQSLIFLTEPTGTIKKEDADFTIEATPKSLNYSKYALKSVRG